MAKRTIGRYPKAFRKMAVERLKGCDNIAALSAELGVHRRPFYKWRDQLEPNGRWQGPPENTKERELRLQVAQLKRLVADKALEPIFSKVPCKKSRHHISVFSSSTMPARDSWKTPTTGSCSRR
jgi:transposase-like protein